MPQQVLGMNDIEQIIYYANDEVLELSDFSRQQLELCLKNLDWHLQFAGECLDELKELADGMDTEDVAYAASVLNAYVRTVEANSVTIREKLE